MFPNYCTGIKPTPPPSRALSNATTEHLQGFAYVEMKSLESVPVVLQLNDRVPDFQKFPVMVKASEAEKNYLAKQASGRVRVGVFHPPKPASHDSPYDMW